MPLFIESYNLILLFMSCKLLLLNILNTESDIQIIRLSHSLCNGYVLAMLFVISKQVLHRLSLCEKVSVMFVFNYHSLIRPYINIVLDTEILGS